MQIRYRSASTSACSHRRAARWHDFDYSVLTAQRSLLCSFRVRAQHWSGPGEDPRLQGPNSRLTPRKCKPRIEVGISYAEVRYLGEDSEKCDATRGSAMTPLLRLAWCDRRHQKHDITKHRSGKAPGVAGMLILHPRLGHAILRDSWCEWKECSGSTRRTGNETCLWIHKDSQ